MHHLVATMHQIGAFFLHLVIIKIGEMVLSIIVDTISQKIYKPASIYYSTYSLR